ncbi:Uncharacterised protein [Kingella potus]|uniref:Uncharacterized protein n=1 Tax=Kingella potus TaxID=265175 RepID=A0A377R1M2_9NEIS|nr:hypothetical protein [Kingella potus]STR02396.1 Uncharacterised protein [Kingella potus]
METAEADAYPVSSETWVPSAPRRNVFQTAAKASGDIWLENPVLPGSIEIDGWADNGRGQLVRGGESVQADYRRGLIQAFPDSYGLTVSAIPAVPVNAARFAAFLEIKDSNQGTQFAPAAAVRPCRAVGVVYVFGGVVHAHRRRRRHSARRSGRSLRHGVGHRLGCP